MKIMKRAEIAKWANGSTVYPQKMAPYKWVKNIKYGYAPT